MTGTGDAPLSIAPPAVPVPSAPSSTRPQSPAPTLAALADAAHTEAGLADAPFADPGLADAALVEPVAAPPAAAPRAAGSPGRRRVTVPARRRAGVLRRAVRREARQLLDRRRLLAITLLAIAGGLGLAGMWARGELGGGDARAYWGAVRIWLNGGDPYHPTGPFMPYVYAPWLLPFFLPWALLPLDVAWFVWRGGTILALLWTVAWAYRRRPLATAVVAFVLAFPMFANLDTGNINVLLILFLWGAQFTGPRLAGFLWALATAMKWIPIVFLPVLAARARLNGVVLLAIAAVLTVLTLPLTLVQLQVLFAIPRPPRYDYLAYLWVVVPWLWRRPDPAWFLRPATWRAWRKAGRLGLARGAAELRADPAGSLARWAREQPGRLLRYFGIRRTDDPGLARNDA